MPLDLDKVEKYFAVAFKVKKMNGILGLTPEFVKQIIASEFGFVSNGGATQREYGAMINAKFIYSGPSGIKPNPNLEKEFDEFRQKKVWGGLQ
jgi:hypothetical protein